MSDIIKMRGRLLLLDEVDLCNRKFSKDCEITIPEKVPVIRDFRFNDPGSVIGSAIVKKDERGYICEAEITNFDRDVLRESFHDRFYIGGYYDHVKLSHDDETGVDVVTKATLRCVGTTLQPSDMDLKMVVVEEEEK